MISEHPRPGKRCWACHTYHYPLPEGLPDRTPLTVVSTHEFQVTARDASGRIWNLDLIRADAGFSCYLDGVCRHESHPEFIAYLYGSLERYRTDTSENDFSRDISRTCWLLERNGHDPDKPPANLKVPAATGTPMPKSTPSPRLPVREQSEPRRMRS